jgi:uncharacterized protein (DUF1778 family)
MSVATETTATVRLEIVITDEQKEMFECAARIEGMTLEEFVISVLEVESENIIRGPQPPLKPLSPQAYKQLVDALENPPEPNERLREAYRRYQALVGE